MFRLLRESGECVISDAGRKAKGHADTILGSSRSQNYTASAINDFVHIAFCGIPRCICRDKQQKFNEHYFKAVHDSAVLATKCDNMNWSSQNFNHSENSRSA